MPETTPENRIRYLENVADSEPNHHSYILIMSLCEIARQLSRIADISEAMADLKSVELDIQKNPFK